MSIKTEIIEALNLSEMCMFLEEETLIDLVLAIVKSHKTQIQKLEEALAQGNQDLLNERESFQRELNKLRQHSGHGEYYFITHEKEKIGVRIINNQVTVFKRRKYYDEMAMQINVEEFNKNA